MAFGGDPDGAGHRALPGFRFHVPFRRGRLHKRRDRGHPIDLKACYAGRHNHRRKTRLREGDLPLLAELVPLSDARDVQDADGGTT
eukprot:scaffold21964_cov118-Isochrysis_galbana.AAC.2